MDALSIYSFKNHLQKIWEMRMGFYESQLIPMSLTRGMTTVEAIPGKK